MREVEAEVKVSTVSRIYSSDAQFLLKEMWEKSHSGFSYIQGCFLKDHLLDKIEVVHTSIKILGGKKKWWEKYGDQARRIAKKLHLAGPNIIDVAPIITPELYEIRTTKYFRHDNYDVIIAKEIVADTLQFLVSGGFVEQRGSTYYKLTLSGHSHYDRQKYK